MSDERALAENAGAFRRDLHTIRQLVALLPEQATDAGGTTFEPVSGTHENPIPGGEAMVMLSPGSNGIAQITAPNDEHEKDERAGEPEPPAYILIDEAQDWRRILNVTAELWTLPGAADFLDEHTTWAVRHHPGFEDTANRIRSCRTHLEGLLKDGDRPEPSGVSCFDCGGQLVRRWRDDKSHRGLDDNRTCRHCQRAYTPAEYFLAIRGHLEDTA